MTQFMSQDFSSAPSCVIDIHTHIYPQKIASKAAKAIDDFYENDDLKDIPQNLRGHVGEFLNYMRAESFSSIDKRGTIEGMFAECEGTPIKWHLVHSVATSPTQVESINDFIAQACKENPTCVGFAAMHQDYQNPGAELDRALSLGLKGVKVHPDIQRVNIDDPRMMALFEAAEARSMPVMIHTGDYRFDFSHPRRLVEVLSTFPHLIIEAAHLGGWSLENGGLEYLSERVLGKSAAKRCFVDTSSSTAFHGTTHMREIVEAYGPQRVMFGCDYPMWNPRIELERFCALGLGEKDMQAICFETAQDFLQMELTYCQS